MAAIKINDILDGITLVINACYPNSRIFSDSVMQGLEPRSFIVTLLTSSIQPYPAKAYEMLPRFKVSYFPSVGREECYDIIDALYDILEVITLADGSKLRGSDMNAEIVDGVLHVFVSFNHFAVQPPNGETMDEMKLTQEG